MFNNQSYIRYIAFESLKPYVYDLNDIIIITSVSKRFKELNKRELIK